MLPFNRAARRLASIKGFQTHGHRGVTVGRDESNPTICEAVFHAKGLVDALVRPRLCMRAVAKCLSGAFQLHDRALP